jgi:hypothetical protein
MSRQAGQPVAIPMEMNRILCEKTREDSMPSYSGEALRLSLEAYFISHIEVRRAKQYFSWQQS